MCRRDRLDVPAMRRMLEARPAYAAKAVLTEAEAARIDEELKPFYERCRRDLAHANF